MKICMITSGHNFYDDRIYYKEVLSLKKEFKKIYIVAPGNEDFTTKQNIFIKVFKKKIGIGGRIQNLRDMYKVALEVNADVYHAHEPDSLLVGYILKKKLRCKVIYDSHEYHPEAFSEHFKIGKSIVEKLIYLYEKFICKRIDAVISVNSILINKFKKFNDNTILIPNYPVISDENLKCKDKRYNDIPTFVYVGGLREDRGILKILEAISYVKKSCKYYFIGPFETDAFKEKVESFVNNNVKQKNVIFTGKVPHLDVFNYLNKCHAGLVILQPNNWRYVNSEPIKLFEYMISNNAIIGSDFPMIRKIVKKCKNGILVDPKSPQQIANAIEKLANNIENTKIMGEKGHTSVLEEYNWEICENKLIDLYRKL